MWTLRPPSDLRRLAFRLKNCRADYSYAPVGCTRTESAPAGFDADDYGCVLGHGQRVFDAARKALKCWKQFPQDWVSIDDPKPRLAVNSVITITAHVCGIWWVNVCRVIYVIDEPDRYGFAYGTLPGHAETGEERFLVTMDLDGVVQYKVLAYSRPNHWAARLAYPIARHTQKRFARDTMRTMQTIASSP